MSHSLSSSASRELRECDVRGVKQKRGDRAGLPRFCANQTCEQTIGIGQAGRFGIIAGIWSRMLICRAKDDEELYDREN